MASPFINFSPFWCISQLHRGVFFTSSETAGCSIYIYIFYLYIHPLSTIRHKPSQTQLITMVYHQYSHNYASSIQYSMLIPYDTYCKLWLFMASTSQHSNAVTTGSIFPRNHLVNIYINQHRSLQNTHQALFIYTNSIIILVSPTISFINHSPNHIM